jgi:hypothetical protein
MKKHFIVLILGLVLSGCSTSWHIKKAEQKCPECFESSLDTIINIIKKDTIIKIDTTILLDFSDYIEIDEPIKIRDTIVKLKPFISDVITKTKEGVIVKIWVKNNRILANIDIDTSLRFHYKQQLRLKDALIQRHVEVIREKNTIIKEKTKFLDWFKLGLILLGVLVLTYILIRIFKK